MEDNMQYYDKYDVGKRIRMLRKNKHLTQSELSSCLDYTNERQLQRIESGESACSVDKLMEVAQVLETSTDFLLFGNNFYERSEMHELENILETRNKGEKLFVKKVIKEIIDNVNLLYN